MKNIVILGSTGSVGRQTLEVVAAHPEEFKVLALGCHFEIEALWTQINKFQPQFVAVAEEKAGQKLARKLASQGEKAVFGITKDKELQEVFLSLADFVVKREK